MDATSRDLKNRVFGLVAKARGLISKEEVTDDVLRERVHAKLGFLVSHPSSIDFDAYAENVNNKCGGQQFPKQHLTQGGFYANCRNYDARSRSRCV
jgi:hypothetical protein